MAFGKIGTENRYLSLRGEFRGHGIPEFRGQYTCAAGQGRVIKRVRTPPRKDGHPPGSESLEVWW